MKNGFLLHSQKHSSPSSINSWIYSKEKWVREKLFFQKTPRNAAMQRGIAIEDAIVSALTGKQSADESIASAVKTFNRELLFSNDGNLEKERATIEPATKLALTVLQDYGVPTFAADGKQLKINTTCKTENWSLPIIGYLDLIYPQYKLIIDIKTAKEIPEDLTAPHRRQASIYKQALIEDGYSVKFLYVNAEKFALYELHDHQDTLKEIKQTLIEQEIFLASSPDREFLLNSLLEKKCTKAS